MVYSDSIRAKQFGIDERVRAFPRTFILAPQQQQTVRLQVRPDRSLAAGTYFTRVKITSNAQTTAVEEVPQEEVATRVSFKFDQVIAAFQKVGTVSTGLEFEDISVVQSEGILRVIPTFKTTGNSPFIGSVMATLKNAQNETIAEQGQTVALYFSGKRTVELKLPENIASGDYTVTLVYETKRGDIPSSDLVQSQSISKTIPVKLN
jgi:methionine-rich copper-binding protein CopC